MKILIIGCGYLGKAAGLAFKAKGHSVSVTTRDPDKALLLHSSFDTVYIWNEDAYEKALTSHDIVLLAAAPSSPEDYNEAYLENGERIASYQQHIKQILYTSSTSVFGECQGEGVSEETPCRPLNRQTEILLETEKALLALPKSCIFRLGELIGPGRTIEGRLRRSGKRPFPGTGQTMTNFSQLTDVINALLFAVERPLFGLYNLCGDLHLQRKELYDKITSSKRLPPIEWDEALTSLHGGNKVVLSNKIKNEGFRFQALPWEGILEETVAF